MNNERKEGTQSQISARAVGGDGYHARDLANVRPGMQHGNAGILSLRSQSFDIGDMKLPGGIFRLDGVKANLVARAAPAGMKIAAYIAGHVFLILHGTPAKLNPLPGLPGKLHFEQNTKPDQKFQVSEKIISRDYSIYRAFFESTQSSGQFRTSFFFALSNCYYLSYDEMT